MPKTLGTSQRLKSEFEIIRMVDGEDLLLFLGRMDTAGDKLALLACRKSVEEVHQHMVWNLSSI